VQRLRLGDDVEQIVEEIRGRMREHGKGSAMWWLSDRATPADLEQQLLELGFAIPDENDIGGMTLTEPPPPAPADVEVVRARDLETYVAARELQWEVFHKPEAQRARERPLLDRDFDEDTTGVFLARIGGRDAGAARSAYSDAGVLLVAGATLPWARGRGVYRALVRARWDDAVARGTPALAVGAGAMSEPILRRLGFREVLRFRRLEDAC
jgi:hypothetical protein